MSNSVNNNCEECIKIQEKQLEIYIKSQEQSRMYNNTIISIGYAAAIVIFSSVQSKLPLLVIQVFGALAIISIVFFVINEIHKSSIEDKADEIFVKALNEERNYIRAIHAWLDQRKISIESFNGFWWKIYFNISLVTGLLAGILLIISIFFPTFTERLLKIPYYLWSMINI